MPRALLRSSRGRHERRHSVPIKVAEFGLDDRQKAYVAQVRSLAHRELAPLARDGQE